MKNDSSDKFIPSSSVKSLKIPAKVLETRDDKDNVIGYRIIYKINRVARALGTELEVDIGDRYMAIVPARKDGIYVDSASGTIEIMARKRRYIIRDPEEADPEWVKRAINTARSEIEEEQSR